MNRNEWDELKDEIAQALVASGCGYGSPVTERFAEVVREVALPFGEHGICATNGCRNPAVTDVGMPVCHVCDEAVGYGATLATANSDLARYGLRIGEGWLEDLEERIRANILIELSGASGLTP